jgi:hypothetical protein
MPAPPLASESVGAGTDFGARNVAQLDYALDALKTLES